MRFAEEILLLLLDENTGYFAPIPEWKMSCALAGGVLMDLALENRIDSDLETLMLVDATPTGDELLDPVLEEIAGDTHRHSPQYWVERIAARPGRVHQRRGIRPTRQARDTRFRFRRVLVPVAQGFAVGAAYPLVDGSPGEEIKGRITRVLLSDEIPDPRDIAIIGLLNNCGGVPTLLEPEEFEVAEQRIELLSGMDLIGRTIGAAVASSYRPPEAYRTVRRRTMPSISLLQMFKSRSLRSGNLPKFLAEVSEELGPSLQA